MTVSGFCFGRTENHIKRNRIKYLTDSYMSVAS